MSDGQDFDKVFVEAIQGNAEAQFKIVLKYRQGVGAQSDDLEAVK